MSELIEYVFGTGQAAPTHWHSAADGDMSGDGVMDAVRLDFDGDGRRDDVLWDVDGDGIADRAGIDRDDNGTPEHWYVDRDGSGVWATPVTGDPHQPAQPPPAPVRPRPVVPLKPAPTQAGLVWSGLDGAAHTETNPEQTGAGRRREVDLDLDGSSDDEVYDIDRDGRADLGLVGAGGGSSTLSADRLYIDADRDGRFDQLLADTDGDGRLDRIVAATDPGFRPVLPP